MSQKLFSFIIFIAQVIQILIKLTQIKIKILQILKKELKDKISSDFDNFCGSISCGWISFNLILYLILTFVKKESKCLLRFFRSRYISIKSRATNIVLHQ